ncbi:MAG: hypothetical protein WBC04_23260 [Candidatus Acidiferrales bacterium]
MGKFDNWMGPERIVMNTVRFYDEFKGTLTPDIDMDGTKRARSHQLARILGLPDEAIEC